MITLLHPSRGRAEKAAETLKYWLYNNISDIPVQHVLSIDNDDDQRQQYFDLFKDSLIVCGDHSNVVQATNQAAKHSNGDILIYLSDDFKCPNDWSGSVKKIFADVNSPQLLKVDDCYQPFDKDVLTIPIMNRRLYERLGYFWNPEYKSMFVDQDLYWVCRNRKWIVYAEHLKFKHEHYCNGYAKKDETYQRSDANWNHGKDLYARRSAEGFTL